MIRGQGFGHGKIILLGEHGVVHGHPALAAGLSVGIQADAVTGSGRLTVPAWSLEAKAGDGTPAGRALAAILTRLRAGDLDFHLEAAIPSRAGLGSSAAMAVAIARAAAAACGGGVGRFRRGDGWRVVPVLQSMQICVGLTGRPRDTGAQVAAVGRLRERAPVVGKLMELFGDLADAGEIALAIGDVDGLGRLLDIAHGVLCGLRVSSPEIETLVHGARAAGAIGAKLTGAGGGGAVIALAPGHERDVLARWRRDGFDGFLASVGPAATHTKGVAP